MLKLNPTVVVKTSPRLFVDKWQYKTTVICPAAAWFRGNNLEHTQEKLNQWRSGGMTRWDSLKVRSTLDFEYCLDIYNLLVNKDNYALRIEHPVLNLYTNDQTLAFSLANIDVARTKFIYVPPLQNKLVENTIIMSRINYGYRVTMGRSRQSHESFAVWASNSKHIKITKRSLDLMKKPNFGGHYFYVKDDSAMTMVKMFLGSDIARIDKIISGNK